MQGKKGYILKFFASVVEESGDTFVQELLGVSGIDTVSPENVEEILSTNFNGNPSI